MYRQHVALGAGTLGRRWWGSGILRIEDGVITVRLLLLPMVLYRSRRIERMPKRRAWFPDWWGVELKLVDDRTGRTVRVAPTPWRARRLLEALSEAGCEVAPSPLGSR